ncbi:MAG: hypothetical protein K8Q92_03445 [Methylophilales bacterium]|nr:hypothetical protein [Methylophilales bacterium]
MNFPRISAKKLVVGLTIIAIACALGVVFSLIRIQQITAFNLAISTSKPPATDKQTDEARFATAYWLAKTERYKDATLIFMQIAEHGDTNQRSAVQYNIGNIFFLRGLAINGVNLTVKNEAEYLLRQAKTAYINSIKLDNSHWDARHNLDRVMGMLPATPTPGVTDSETPGIIMGNIPVGLP